MPSIIKEMFSTPVWIIDDVYTDPREISQQALLRIQSKNLTPPKWQCNSLSTYSYDSQLHKSLDFKPLIDKIMESVNQYTQNYWKMNSRMINCWANLSKSLHFQEQHHHLGISPLQVSAVYYSQVQDNEKLTFHPPFINFSVFGEHFEKIDIKTNRLVIFPAYLEHSFRPVERTIDKISLSFNFELDLPSISTV
jgi:hypothetical protein